MNREEKIEALRQIYREYHQDPRFTKLRTHHPPKRVVPGRGSMDPLAILVGEAPGEFEAMTRRPFHPDAPAGRILNELLASIGWDRKQLFITNAVKYRPTTGINNIRNRKPFTSECQASRSYLYRELDLFPGVPVIALGSIATRCLKRPRSLDLDIWMNNVGHPVMGDIHGTGWSVDGRSFFCLYHPALATYHPGDKITMLADMVKVKAWMDDYCELCHGWHGVDIDCGT